MKKTHWIRAIALLLVIAGAAAPLIASSPGAGKAGLAATEPAESITLAVAMKREHRPTMTAIGTVAALRSVSLRSELPGTVREVHLDPGTIVDAGATLLRLDVSVEEADLKAQEAQFALADSLLGRIERAIKSRSASEAELDRARAERDIARAQVDRTRAIIARKTIRAPFRGRLGLSDIHPGQYLEQGALLTTLQGVDEGAHVYFSVPQSVASSLRVGDTVDVAGRAATIAAMDARVDAATRSAAIRAKIEGDAPSPGSSVRVKVPTGSARLGIVIPANALRKGPEGDHVFVVAPGPDGKPRAAARRVVAGELLGDEILIEEGLTSEEQVAASGSFKLRDGALVASR